MEFGASFWINSILLGIALAMDAFSVSAADALNEPDMTRSRSCLIAGTFAGFQFAMPMIGWICVHTVALYFTAFQKAVPWIAVILLGYLGIKMILEGRQKEEAEETDHHLAAGGLLMQGVATSIDALSVGFAIEEYTPWGAFLCAVVIAVVTFFICLAGLAAGKKLGMVVKSGAHILGGCILLFIGIRILVSGL